MEHLGYYNSIRVDQIPMFSHEQKALAPRSPRSPRSRVGGA